MIKSFMEMISSITVILSLTGCILPENTDTQDIEGVMPLTWALAVDPGCPFTVDELAEALGDGFARWEEAPSPLSMHYQGAGDVPIIENDGLQVVWIWWGSTPWESDDEALVLQRTWINNSGHVRGFDLTINGPNCLGDKELEDGSNLYNKASNTVAHALGAAFGAIDPLGRGTPLSDGACHGEEPLFPNEDELRAILGE